MKLTVIPVVVDARETVPLALELEISGRIGNQRYNRDHLDYSIKIGKNTEDLNRVAITFTPVKDHLLMLV